MATPGTDIAPPARTRRHPIEHFARVHHDTAERWLRRKFAGSLTDEDVSDALAETYRHALEDERTAAFDHGRMKGWAYSALRNRAIEIIRRRDGRNGTRPRDASYDELVDRIEFDVVDQSADLDELDRAQLVRQTQLVGEALDKLPDDERAVVQHVVLDQLSLRGVAQLLGTSKSSVDRLHQRGVKRLVALCAAVEHGPDCMRARELLTDGHAPTSSELGWRDAHLAGCFGCQVAAGRRVGIFMPLMPEIPIPGRLSDVVARVTSLLARGGELPQEAAVAGVGSAAGGGLGSTLLGGGAVSAKFATCAAAGLAAVACVGAAPKLVASQKPVRAQAARVAVATATQAPAQAAAGLPERPTGAGTLAAGVTTNIAAERNVARRKATRDASREFGPESFRQPLAAATPAPRSQPVAAAAAAAASPKSSSSSTGFSEEFTP